MICFYHNDNDGMCAGNWVYRLAPDDGYIKRFVVMDYGPEYEIPWADIHPNEIVYIVDFSFDPDDMIKLLNITTDVIWIDHHATAINKYKDFKTNIKGVRNTNHSGCMLTWWYLKFGCHKYNLKDYMLKDAPKITKLVDDWDMWEFKYKETRAFNEGFKSYPHGPESNIWEQLEKDESLAMKIIDEGNIIVNYRNSIMSELISKYGFESKIDGYSAFCFNQGDISSFDFESIDMNKYDVIIGFVFNGDEYVYSLRTSKDINISQIAVKYGGGGHPKSAGFHHKDLIL